MIRSLILFAIVSSFPAAHAADTWTPPIGVPKPSFGMTETAPPAPSPWVLPTPGFYYVCQSCLGATDAANPYGTPARPRATIPNQASGGALPAGSVVELHGTYRQYHSRPNNILAYGTALRPIFIRGASAEQAPAVTRSWEIDGTYFFVENLKWMMEPTTAYDKGSALMVGDHFSFRNNEVQGSLTSGQVVPVGNNVLIYKNYIHDAGNYATTKDQDVHCIAVGKGNHHLWVLDNVMARCTGDGIQLNGDGDVNSIHHVFVGRNVSFGHRQNGFWTKSARDVVFSQNVAFGFKSAQWGGGGAGMGWQYEPTNVWFLYNHIALAEGGIVSGSSNSFTYDMNIFIIGNVIHDIHLPGGFPVVDGWGPAAITLIGGSQRYVLNNTIYNVDMGISVAYWMPAYIANNIISNVTRPESAHIVIDNAQTTITNNLFYQNGAPARILNAGRLSNPLTADPLFVNPAAADFHLQPGSPAVDRGADLSALANLYALLYGASIQVDFDGNTRPLGLGWDIGAYEAK